jgi:hypothetical protein
MNPIYPIYILSKGRHESRLTAKYLEYVNIDYKIVIEPQEYDLYASVIDSKKIIVLPFSNLGLGGIPARNFIFEHAVQLGVKRHWILDDNIDGFGRLHNNFKIKFGTGIFFRIIEDFVDRYSNIAMAGCEYDYFLPRKVELKPYRQNTRIYSNILINNSIPHRWRGRYNEDTDLSLRCLKDGMCTILFQAIFAYKTPTMQMKGGNTDGIYNVGDNRREFAESLQRQHPDLVKVVNRYGRVHHEVNYKLFKKNKLIKVKNSDLDSSNDFNLVLKEFTDEELKK